VLISFDKLEALRNASILSAGGTAFVNNAYLTPVTVSSGQQPDVADLDERLKGAFKKLVLVDAMKIAQEDVGNPRTMNMVIAGALSAFCPFEEKVWHEALAQLLTGPKAKLLEVNLKAFALGRASVTAHRA
jgi:indolepyruvate ferredoxin oxidoreductase, beta subunit